MPVSFLLAQRGEDAARQGEFLDGVTPVIQPEEFYRGNDNDISDNDINDEISADVTPPPPARWYRSNAAGMALEYIPSRLVALRNQYALSVETVAPAEIPEILLPYFDDSHRVELRTLFREGGEFRRQWIFRDDRGFAMLVSSGSACFFGGESVEEEESSGFMEFRNNEGAIVRERFFMEDLSQWEFRFFFEENILRSSETWFKAAPATEPTEEPALAYSEEYEYYEYDREDQIVIETEAVEIAETVTEEEGFPHTIPEFIPEFVLVHTDMYRYTRSGSLRAIDRVFHEGVGEGMDRVYFPRPGPVAAFEREIGETGTVAVFYTPEFILHAINVEYGARVTYTLDSRGRLISEVWRDEDGRVVGEFRNTWLGDRLISVLWRTDDDERLVEYEYNDAGDRVEERNFRHGALERRVTSRNGRDIEDLYMSGRLILRAIWEDGLKISEERISQAGRGVN